VPWMSSFYRVWTFFFIYFTWVGALHIYVAMEDSILSAHAKASKVEAAKNLIDWPAKSQGSLWMTTPPRSKGERKGVKSGEDVECKNLRDKYKMAETYGTTQMKLWTVSFMAFPFGNYRIRWRYECTHWQLLSCLAFVICL